LIRQRFMGGAKAQLSGCHRNSALGLTAAAAGAHDTTRMVSGNQAALISDGIVLGYFALIVPPV
jgi:hypothetical protein